MSEAPFFSPSDMLELERQLDAAISITMTNDSGWLDDTPRSLKPRSYSSTPVPKARRTGLTTKTEMICLRVPHGTIKEIRDEASRAGIPYQTLINQRLAATIGTRCST